jgi:DNA-binding transcriptional regulator WhiA
MGVLSKEQQDMVAVKKRLLKTLKLYFGTQTATRISEKTKINKQEVYKYFKKPKSNALIEEEILVMLREAQERQQALIEAEKIGMSLNQPCHVD